MSSKKKPWIRQFARKRSNCAQGGVFNGATDRRLTTYLVETEVQEPSRLPIPRPPVSTQGARPVKNHQPSVTALSIVPDWFRFLFFCFVAVLTSFSARQENCREKATGEQTVQGQGFRAGRSRPLEAYPFSLLLRCRPCRIGITISRQKDSTSRPMTLHWFSVSLAAADRWVCYFDIIQHDS